MPLSSAKAVAFIMTRNRAAPDGSAKVAWFADPDGNVLSLTES
jgi:hypothetical protein